MRKVTKLVCILAIAVMMSVSTASAAELSDKDIDNLVRRSFQYVAMYNVINKAAMDKKNPMVTGWNGTFAAKGLLDHTMKAIARPNNDTLYVTSILDMRSEPVVVHYPAFDSKFVALETSAYDHYCDVPLSTTKGDFKKPLNVLYYTDRTKGYKGEPVKGVDKIVKMSGDFAIVFLRVMPHAAEPERMKKNLEAMQKVNVKTLSEFLGKEKKPAEKVEFPTYSSDFGIYENNFLEVMQFVFNHTTFDPKDKMDKAVLAAFKPLGVEPGKTYDPKKVAKIDGKKLAEAAKKLQKKAIATFNKPEGHPFVARIRRAIFNKPGGNPYVYDMFLPKGKMKLEPMWMQSAVGPIGLPAHQAIYPPVTTADGKPMNAQHDYVVRMKKDQMPPAKAFWSVTLYDLKNGFFIPNDRKKYSVGENAGMKLNKDGGIEIYIAAEKPKDVPEENWLPINRKDEPIDMVMRIYHPDLDKMKSWKAPKAEKRK